MTTSILLVDDHRLIRDGIKGYLDLDWIDIVGEAENGEDAIRLTEKLNPDLVLMDISMPKLNGMEAAQKILEGDEAVKIIMLSMYLDEKYLFKCMEIGVNGFIYKGADKYEIITGIQEVMEGETFYSKEIKEILIKSYSNNLKAKKKGLSQKVDTLTQREKEVVRYIMKGYTSQQIAEALFISPRTVDTHRTNLMHKLEVKNSIELINKVHKLDLLEEDQ